MGFFAPEIGIDLGTSTTRVYVRNRGIIISEPTIVVTQASDRRKVRAVGDEAKYLLGRTTASLVATQPISGGTIADFDMTEVLLRYFMRKAIGVSYLSKPKVVIAIPSSLPTVGRKAVEEAARLAGAKHVFLVEKPYAAAIGTGLPVYEAVGSLVVDIGGGTTDAALVSLGGIVIAKSIQMGGNHMDESVSAYIRKEHNMLVGPKTAQDVKKDLGAAITMKENRRARIRGRDTIFSSAKDIEFTSAQCYEALCEPCSAILAAIKWVLERTPPELASDIMRGGIHLTGGASQLLGLDQYIASELSIPVLLAKEPEDCTILGIGYLVENMQLLSSAFRQSASAE